jgi:hypothetical protein
VESDQVQRARRMVVVFAVAVASVVTATVSQSAAAESPPAPGALLTSFESTAESFSVWAARLQIGSPQVFTGVVYDRGSVRLLLSPKASAPWLAEALATILKPASSNVVDDAGREVENPSKTPIRVDVVQSRYSFEVLDRVRSEVRDILGDAWTGDSIVGDSLRFETEADIDGSQMSAIQKSLAGSSIDAATVSFEPGHTKAHLTSRSSDLVSHYAGATILASGMATGCTSGFTMQVGGTRKMLTAGHCVANGSGNPSRFYSSTADAAHYIGDLWSHWCGLCDDVGWLSGSQYAGRMYTGGPYTSTWTTVKGYYSAVPATVNLYASGQGYGDRGPAAVPAAQDFDMCVATSSHGTICHVNRISSTIYMWQGGDSGGPVYANDYLGGRYAVGFMDAAGGNDYYYVPVSWIIAAYGAAVVTTY